MDTDDTHMSVSSKMESGPVHIDDSLAMILCCLCGTKIKSNPSNMCVNCLRGQVDITQGISKQVTLFFCRGCGRYQRPPWVNAQLESREMLALCLKKIKGLNKDVKLVDAKFIWTEPHSRRIKVQCTVQKEVMNSAIMQQNFVVEFVVTNQQCTDCQKSYTEHTWTAVVQLRQKLKHKRTFYWLEQLLLKHSVADKCINVKEQTEGLDFFWGSKSNANAMIHFLQAVCPIQFRTSKRLISSDLNSNVHNFKYTFAVEIAPICRDDMVILPRKLASSLGVPPLMLVIKLTNAIHLIDPTTLKRVEVSSEKYWRQPFRASLNSRQMVEYVILDSEVESPYNSNPDGYSTKYKLAEVQCARASDFGQNDTVFRTMTHLGHLLQPGDHVMGYDIASTNFNDDATVPLKDKELPEVVLVKKFYPNRKNRSRSRKFKLRQLPKDQSELRKNDLKRAEEDYEEFLQEVEEDPEMWDQVNMYRRDRAESIIESKLGDDEDDNFPQIPLDKLLDDLTISGKQNNAAGGPAEAEMDNAVMEEDEDDDDIPLEEDVPQASSSNKFTSLQDQHDVDEDL